MGKALKLYPSWRMSVNVQQPLKTNVQANNQVQKTFASTVQHKGRKGAHLFLTFATPGLAVSDPI